MCRLSQREFATAGRLSEVVSIRRTAAVSEVGADTANASAATLPPLRV